MTSGLLVVAKDDFTHNNLSKQFRDRKLKDIMFVLLLGLPQSEGIIDGNIKRSRYDRKNDGL